MRTIAIINQKGGIGKTTTAVNLGAALAARDHRVLLVDLDPQAHMTLHVGLELGPEADSISSVLCDGTPIEKAQHVCQENLSVVGSNIDLAAAEVELVSVVGREVLLRDAFEAVQDRFDYCLIDCPPSLGVLTLNALAASDEVIIPLQAHFLALQGLGKLLETVALVNKRINPRLRVAGVLLCMFENSTRLSGEVVADLRNFLGDARDTDVPWSQAEIFKTVIRRNVRLAESPSYGQTIFDYAPRCPGASDYASLARELLGIPDDENAIVAEQPIQAAAVAEKKVAGPPKPSPSVTKSAKPARKATADSRPAKSVAKQPATGTDALVPL
jgi:chromosome partitioning protein